MGNGVKGVYFISALQPIFWLIKIELKQIFYSFFCYIWGQHWTVANVISNDFFVFKKKHTFPLPSTFLLRSDVSGLCLCQVPVAAACRWGRDAIQCRISCCEVDKHSSGLLSRKAILDVLRQHGNLIYGRNPPALAGAMGRRSVGHERISVFRGSWRGHTQQI